MNTQFGIDVLLDDEARLARLKSAKVALVAHPASVTAGNQHSLDALISAGCTVTKAFGPQHGMRGDKQDNMIGSDDYIDPVHGIPVVSLYGPHLQPTPEMLADIDIVLFDLQDVGCRIYTYNALLRYFLEALSGTDKALWVLDRPNPAGRPVDGLRLEPGEESIVGFDEIPTRFGLTIGELSRWMISRHGFDLPCDVIALKNYDIEAAPGFGWPVFERPWVNPSPNASSVNMARCFPGTVLIEGTELSEGRGTTTPLEVIGAPGLPVRDIIAVMQKEAPDWLQGAWIRPCHFETTFHKHSGELSEGVQVHTDSSSYRHDVFKPYRVVAGLLKALRLVDPEYAIWRDHEYEFELDRRPIDVINGGSALRRWVDDPGATFDALDETINAQCQAWLDERDPFLEYR
jgi:uncharacterized protein YbbC (DUF1343 family)